MAINIQSNYSGEVLDTLLIKATTQNDLVAKGLVRVEPNISHKFHIPRLRTAGKILQKRKELPKHSDAKGDFNITEKTLEPREFMAFTTFNPRSFEKIWKSFQPKGNLVFAELPSSVQEKLLEELAKVVDFELGWHVVNGEYGDTDEQLFDGILTRIRKDNTTLKVVNPHVLTADNIINEFKKAYALIPATIRGKQGLKMLVSQADFDKYDDALSAMPNKGGNVTDINIKRFKGITIEIISDMPENTFVIGVTGTDLNTNFWMGVAAANDQTTIKIDLLENAGELYFFKMLMKADMQIIFGDEIVFYDGLNATEEAITPEASLTLSTKAISFPKSGSTKSANVIASCDFTVTPGNDNAGFSHTVEGNVIKLTAEANTGVERTGSYTVTLDGHASISEVLTITQSAGN